MTRPHPIVAAVALIAVPFVWLGFGAFALAALAAILVAGLALVVAIIVWPWHVAALLGVAAVLAASFLMPLWILIGIEKLILAADRKWKKA